MPKPPENLRDFSSLLKVVENLRGPDGCPWDKEQTHATLTRYLIEEAFELSEAIDSGQASAMRDELGDVLFQVVLHSEIARQENKFDIHDVILGLNEKMVRRHPHVFADVNVADSSEVIRNWNTLKAKEKGSRPVFDIPVALPALLRSQKIGEKTEKLAFDWENSAGCWAKLSEEIGELDEAMTSGSLEEMEGELGDVLFCVAQLARHLKLDAEQCLRKANTRFETRFSKMQELVAGEGSDWTKLSVEEKETFWQKAKRILGKTS